MDELFTRQRLDGAWCVSQKNVLNCDIQLMQVADLDRQSRSDERQLENTARYAQGLVSKTHVAGVPLVAVVIVCHVVQRLVVDSDVRRSKRAEPKCEVSEFRRHIDVQRTATLCAETEREK